MLSVRVQKKIFLFFFFFFWGGGGGVTKKKRKCNLFTYGAPGVYKNSFEIPVHRIGIWKCWFLRRGEKRSTGRKTSRSRVENQQQTQSTYDAGSGNRIQATLVGGEHSHHFAIPYISGCIVFFVFVFLFVCILAFNSFLCFVLIFYSFFFFPSMICSVTQAYREPKSSYSVTRANLDSKVFLVFAIFSPKKIYIREVKHDVYG